METIPATTVLHSNLAQLQNLGALVLEQCNSSLAFQETHVFQRLHSSGEIQAFAEAIVHAYASLMSLIEADPLLLETLWPAISSLSAMQAFLALNSATLRTDGVVSSLFPSLFENHWLKIKKTLARLMRIHYQLSSLSAHAKTLH